MTELFLYQTIHLARGRARNLSAHTALLDTSSRELFGREYRPRRLAERIEALAAAEGYPHAVSGFIRLELLPDGKDRLLPAGISLYDGYALRSLMPEGICIEYDLPVSEAPTSAREAATLLARQCAVTADADLAVRCDRSGVLRSADDAALFGVCENAVVPGPFVPCVERALVLQAVRAAGIPLSDVPLSRELLPHLDELFFADHRGLTSLGSCDGFRLMSLVAERIAGAMEGLFSKK